MVQIRGAPAGDGRSEKARRQEGEVPLPARREQSGRGAAGLPAICLNMIVRNEAHIVREVLNSVAPYICSWVIVDTGSDDGTQDLIRDHMAALGIPGELHERPWQNFGANRSEALELAAGHGEYIWVIDADDLVVGDLDLTGLSADAYQLRIGDRASCSLWRTQLLRDGLPWRYVGVVHEFVFCHQMVVQHRLEGDYYIDSRRLGDRSQSPQKYERDRDLLLAEIQRNPHDGRSVFYLAQSYFDLGDFVNALLWYRRRADMGGWQEEVYVAKLRVADSMAQLDEHWPDVQDAYLTAWEYRPTRAEALYEIARHYRMTKRYQIGYLFAERAARIPFPEGDELFVGGDVHAWRALDEQAVCASWTGRTSTAFELCRQLIARTSLPDEQRNRIAANRDFQVPLLLDSAARYPQDRVRALSAGPRGEVTVSLIAGPELDVTERSLNSLLNTCGDLARIDRVLLLDRGLAPEQRATLAAKYPFLDLTEEPLFKIPQTISARFWLHVDAGWQFFAPEMLISRLISVLAAELSVFQVGVNFTDATELIGTFAAEGMVRRTCDGGRYVLTDTVARGPALFDVARLRQAGGFAAADDDPFTALGRRAASHGLRTATLDEVLCIRIPRPFAS